MNMSTIVFMVMLNLWDVNQTTWENTKNLNVWEIVKNVVKN